MQASAYASDKPLNYYAVVRNIWMNLSPFTTHNVTQSFQTLSFSLFVRFNPIPVSQQETLTCQGWIFFNDDRPYSRYKRGSEIKRFAGEHEDTG